MTSITRSTQSRRAMLAAAVVAAASMAGCASLSTKTTEQEVAELAQQRWDLLVNGDFDKAYQFTQPGYRALASVDDYKKRFGGAGRWKAAKVLGATCEADRCSVRIHLTTINRVPGFTRSLPELSTHFDEVWLRDEGRWWYYQAS